MDPQVWSALIAVIGTLVGASVGAFAAIRASRQAIEANAKTQREVWARQDRDRFLDERRRVYIRVLELTDDVRRRALYATDNGPDPELERHVRDLDMARAEVRLISRSRAVYEATGVLWDTLMKLVQRRGSLTTDGVLLDPDAQNLEVQNAFTVSDFARLAAAELSVESGSESLSLPHYDWLDNS